MRCSGLYHQQHSMNRASADHTLKYLGFFPVALASVSVYFAAVYKAAKDQAGPLKPGVEDVEEVLKAVVRPVLVIAANQSTKLLNYVDKKVDEKLKMVDDYLTAFMKPSKDILNVKSWLDSATSSHGVSYKKEGYSEDSTQDTLEKLVAGLHMTGVVTMLGPSAMYSAQLFNQFASVLREAQVPFSCFIPEVPVQMLERVLKISSTDAPSWQTWQAYECDGAC